MCLPGSVSSEIVSSFSIQEIRFLSEEHIIRSGKITNKGAPTFQIFTCLDKKRSTMGFVLKIYLLTEDAWSVNITFLKLITE